MKAALKDQMKEAMKAKDKIRLDAIRGILSEIQYEEMQKGIDTLDSEASLQVIQRGLKKLKEESEFAEKASRSDLLEKLKLEVAVFESLLPKQLTEAELESAIRSMKDADQGLTMSTAMKGLKEKFSGQYDGKLASEVAKRVFV